MTSKVTEKSIDIRNETGIRLKDLADNVDNLLPAKMSYNGVRRWTDRGIKCRDGKVITLEHYAAGGTIWTSHEALARFNAARNT